MCVCAHLRVCLRECARAFLCVRACVCLRVKICFTAFYFIFVGMSVNTHREKGLGMVSRAVAAIAL